MSRSVRQALIDRDHQQLSLVRQCILLAVSRASVYYRPVPTRAEDLELMALMDRQYLKTPFYGSRKMKAWLLGEGYLVSRKRVRRLMRLMGLEAIYRRPNTSKPAPGQDHTAEGGVGVKVGLGNRQVVHRMARTLDATSSTAPRPELHSGAYVRHENDRRVPIDLICSDGLVEVIVVNLAVVLTPYHNIARFQHAQYLDNAVVGVLGKVDHAVGEELAPQVQAVHIALGPAGGDVAPCLLPGQAHHVSEMPDDFALYLVGVAAEIAVVKRVSDVVGAILQKGESSSE